MKNFIVESIRSGITDREALSEKIGLSDRKIRRIIADECPEIGECGNGYYFKQTTDDCVKHECFLKARIKKLAERYRRCVEHRLDIQHHIGKVTEMIKSWTMYTDDNLRIVKTWHKVNGLEVPEHLRQS
jgi:hypothetical protein